MIEKKEASVDPLAKAGSGAINTTPTGRRIVALAMAMHGKGNNGQIAALAMATRGNGTVGQVSGVHGEYKDG